jgi:hypothetical protein
MHTLFDLVQQGDIPFFRVLALLRDVSDNMVIFHMWYRLRQCGELVEMCRKQAEAMYRGRNVPTLAFSMNPANCALQSLTR